MTAEPSEFNIPSVTGEPDFANLLAVLENDTPSRPTLFEFLLNGPLCERFTGSPEPPATKPLSQLRWLIQAFTSAGYDYATTYGSALSFPQGDGELGGFRQAGETCICDRETLDAYPWPDPDDFDYSNLDKVSPDLPNKSKLVVCGPGGVLENAISLVGFENLSMLLVDAPDLLSNIFERIGKVLVRHYELAAPHENVGACIGNDDWGFKTQTMLPPDAMRRYVFPWHKRIVEAIHSAGKPAILHSCGKLNDVYPDIIEDIGYDAKHSYEDAIQPVEEAYEELNGDVAVLGGIDVDYVCRRSPQEIYQRSKDMLERASGRGGYALGTGNSVPEYIPDEHYFAMTAAALELR